MISVCTLQLAHADQLQLPRLLSAVICMCHLCMKHCIKCLYLYFSEYGVKGVHFNERSRDEQVSSTPFLRQEKT